jgi:integrase
MNHIVDKFLNQYPGKSTRQTYNSALNWFFQSVKVDADSYFNQQRDYTSDVNNFKLFLNGRPPKTVHTYLMAVKQFLLENNVDLGVRFWKNLRNRSKMKKVKAVTKVVTVTKEQIRQMLSHATVRDRAIVLTLISSGMRIGECLLIKLRDIDFTKDPVQIDIQGINTKNGERRTVFISYEAKAALEEWLKVREQWLYSSITRLNGIGRNKSLDDDRLFPYNRLTIVMSFERMLKAAHLYEKDKVTNRTLIHPHIFRKFFSTNLPDGMRKDMVERLLGHSGYLDGVYDNFTDDEMAV